MTQRNVRTGLAMLALAALCVPSLQAATVLKMDLEDMCDRAGRIFRGTVVSVTPGSITLGGGEIPIQTYLLKVTEEFKGTFDSKDGQSFVEMQVVAPPKSYVDGTTVRFSKLPELPQLNVGDDYLLITSSPSSAGLSATIGLGQGCFAISGVGKDETATNEFGNVGLYDGPVAYQDLANDIRAALGQ